MRLLKLGVKGPDVKRWQHFLLGQGATDVVASGTFDEPTREATREFQRRHELDVDGKVGDQTLGQALLLGFSVVADPADEEETGPNFPAKPDFAPLVGTQERQKIFGRFRFRPAPVAGNRENIEILDNWEAQNIVAVEVPQLAGVHGAPASRRPRFHRRAAGQFQALWKDWEDEGLLDQVLTWHGTFTPRFVRGSTSTLSNHAFGSAFDINVAFNPLGARPALVGQHGSVRRLVRVAHRHGFYWGGHFTRIDGMHFEVAQVRG
ncbi:MAG TPA: M15 family metallopeptidase [Thermoanaerobaculia bacterium]|nr:M15 family metallopeptidase [Thermoanaerobaculia bacterium]